MRFQKIIFLIFFIFLVFLVGGFLNKNIRVSDINVSVPNVITSPLVIQGEARGTWYFEADFPVFLLDENDNQIALAIAFAQDDWMTEDFVPFRAELEFNVTKKMKGTLVFKKDNPSDLPEYDDQLEIPVVISNE